MKKIINGKLYNTDTARSIGSDFYGAYRRDLNFWNEELFQKKTGEYFLHGEGGPMTKYGQEVGQNEWSGGEKIIPMSYNSAKKWAEEHLTEEEYGSAFGAVPEDAEDQVLSVSLPGQTAQKLRQMAAQNGKTISGQVAELVTNA